jgi:methylated-DNA-protein-cysteine methyltransferase-like protein
MRTWPILGLLTLVHVKGLEKMTWHDARDVPEVLRLRIYEVVREVPAGCVATYGDIAVIVGSGCDARTVGYALNMIPKTQSEPVPWQRIVNAQGGISTSGLLQRKLLEDEHIHFDPDGRIPLRRYRWTGPTAEWAVEHGFHTLASDEDESPEQLSLF